jgi:hypothetical protein
MARHWLGVLHAIAAKSVPDFKDELAIVQEEPPLTDFTIPVPIPAAMQTELDGQVTAFSATRLGDEKVAFQ